MVLNVAGLSAGQSVLDIGCGPGAAVRRAAPHVSRSVGVDRSPAMVRIAKRRSTKHENVFYSTAQAEALPFGDDEFDVIWTIHTYHHWEAPASGLAEAKRVLRPEGRFIIVETNTNGSHGMTRQAAEHLETRLRLHGFAETEITRHGRELVVTAVAGW
jgi:ubiquinone/menaquinone biosynthesis C-methylase UbiE